jgi:hypothetical protein
MIFKNVKQQTYNYMETARSKKQQQLMDTSPNARTLAGS